VSAPLIHSATFSFGNDAAGQQLRCVLQYDPVLHKIRMAAHRGESVHVEYRKFDNVNEADEFYFGLLQRQHYLRNWTCWRTHPNRGFLT
jgi:hypothetical protein